MSNYTKIYMQNSISRYYFISNIILKKIYNAGRACFLLLLWEIRREKKARNISPLFSPVSLFVAVTVDKINISNVMSVVADIITLLSLFLMMLLICFCCYAYLYLTEFKCGLAYIFIFRKI